MYSMKHYNELQYSKVYSTVQYNKVCTCTCIVKYSTGLGFCFILQEDTKLAACNTCKHTN